MVYCERIEKCPIVNDAAGSSAADFDKIKEAYCYENYSECARYQVLKAVGGDFVPKELQPGEVDKVEEIIAEAQEWL